jgi:hypothetical protein
MSGDSIAYDKSDLRGIYAAFKAMDDEAVAEAKNVSNGLATYLKGKIESAASGANNRVAPLIASGSVISKSSKTGDISFGFARQKLSGGGTTQQLWGGYEFGSNKFKQFPVWSGTQGRGSRGWFIYPTLRAEQPAIIDQWEKSFDKILKEW